MQKKIVSALSYLHLNERRHLDLQIKIAEITATYFNEKARADYMADMFSLLDLQVSVDSVGNVRAYRAGKNKNVIIMAAHLDAAFPETTKFEVNKSGNKYYGPSIVDNSLGLVGMLALVEAMNEADIKTQCGLLFVATVGEEGLGDLRGVKALMSDQQLLQQVKGFIALDSQGDSHVMNRALGSKRYKVVIEGLGGHSYLAYGNLNPLSAVAEIINNIDDIEIPKKPKTSMNVGLVSGGVSVNVIPKTATIEVDLRSEDREKLSFIEGQFLSAVEDGINTINNKSADPENRLSYNICLTGDRPCGETLEDQALVLSAKEAGEKLQLDTSYGTASSDANVPMSLGIPSIMLGAGGKGGGLHTENEWFDPTNAYLGRQRALLTLLMFDRDCL